MTRISHEEKVSATQWLFNQDYRSPLRLEDCCSWINFFLESGGYDFELTPTLIKQWVKSKTPEDAISSLEGLITQSGANLASIPGRLREGASNDEIEHFNFMKTLGVGAMAVLAA